ncbi:MAG: tetratricopeptide repeat protein [bacterium]
MVRKNRSEEYLPPTAPSTQKNKQVDFQTADIPVEKIYSQNVTVHQSKPNQYLENSNSLPNEYVEGTVAFASERFTTEHVLEMHFDAGKKSAESGHFDQAIQYYEQAVALSKKLGYQKHQAHTLRLLGNIYLLQGRNAEAIEKYTLSLGICLNTGELLDEAYVLNSLAGAHFQNAAWRKMERVCRRALAIAEDCGEDELIACIYNNLGAMYCVRNQRDKALINFHKCLPLFEKLGDLRGLAETYNNMATIYRDHSSWREATKYYAQSLHFSRLAGDEQTRANATLNRVEMYILRNDLDLAERHCRDALEMFQELGNQSGKADALKNLAAIQTRQKRWTSAKRNFNKAIKINKEYRNYNGLAETFSSYAELFSTQGDTEKTLKCLRKSLKYYSKLKTRNNILAIENKIREIQVSDETSVN